LRLHSRHVPFWELEELGGDDTLQGFLPRRFLGSGRVLLNAEYRARLGGFTFFRLWYVQFDGAVFGGVGRVFIDRDELGQRFAPSDTERLRVAGRPGAADRAFAGARGADRRRLQPGRNGDPLPRLWVRLLTLLTGPTAARPHTVSCAWLSRRMASGVAADSRGAPGWLRSRGGRP